MDHGPPTARDPAPPGRAPAAGAAKGLAAGWYRHPSRELEHRYWDGARWHEQAAPRSTRPPVDPLTPAGGDLWWDPKSDAMVWSPEVLALHGYRSRPTGVGLRLLLDHVVADDRDRVAAAFAEQRRPGTGALRSSHHLVSEDGVGRSVLLTVSRVDAAGSPHRHGFLVDLGPQLAQAADAAVVAAREGSSAVQRAVGVLAVFLDLDEDAAAGLLRRLSSERNSKMRDVATQLVDAAKRQERTRSRSQPWSVAHLLDDRRRPHGG